MRIKRLRVAGMSCAHCERKAAAAASAIRGVAAAKADAARGILELALEESFDESAGYGELSSALEAAGYTLIARTSTGSDARDKLFAFFIGLALAAGFWVADHNGIFTAIPVIENGLGLGAIFVTGLLCSLHCVSMCGGLALAQGSRGLGAPRAREAMLPSLSYNAGRILSYTAIGAAIGAAGEVLRIGAGGRALILGIAGAFMLLMGLSLAGWLSLPRVRWNAFRRFSDRTRAAAVRLGPFAVGLANGFIPCGPLQAMQVFALGSGSALAGALAMFAFSLGTTPLLFAFGIGGALVPPRYRTFAVRAGAVLVMFLGLTTLGRAWALAPGRGPALWEAASAKPGQGQAASGPAPAAAGPQAAAGGQQAAGGASAPKPSGQQATLMAGYQEVMIAVGSRNYGEIIVQAGVPVRFNLSVAPGALNGCNNAIVIPSMNIQKALNVGDNIVEFLPESPGVIPYSCWMGMIRSRITVVAKLEQAAP
jgi:sulfite exporter TauE/SafE/copper chaperone CopZ